MTNSAAIKSIAKNLVLSLPYAKKKYLRKEFYKRSPACLGTYKTFAQALQDAPPGKLIGHNHSDISEFYKLSVDNRNPADYPILFWLSRLLPETKLVFELGGSVGVGYYSFRRYIPFPPQVRWVISEVSDAVRLGREIAQERNESRLTFTVEREVEENPDIYATFGTLQYIEEPFAEIIGKLRAKPPHILLNRVPLAERESFVTLQNNGGWFSPYKIDNRAGFVKSIEALNYEVVDEWDMPRHNTFLEYTEDMVPKYHGMYFRLKG